MDSRASVSIPQAVWIACNPSHPSPLPSHPCVSIPQAVWIACNDVRPADVDFDAKFQYRKRYGLHAITTVAPHPSQCRGFNTASGMDCMQFDNSFLSDIPNGVSIPQAVWIACNNCARKSNAKVRRFQYRKRYGLHAILSPRTLENSEPRNRFSNTPSLFALFPKPQGTFLSQKAVQKGCEASNIKETFVHEENLKLMAVSRKSHTSL